MPLNRTLAEMAALAGCKVAEAVLDDPLPQVIVVIPNGERSRAVWSNMTEAEMRTALRRITAADSVGRGVRDCEAPS